MEEITKRQEEAENAAAPLSLPDDNGLTILRLSDNCQLPTKTRLNSSGGGMYSGTLGDSTPTTKESQTQVCGGQKRGGPESSLRCPERVSVLTPEFIYVQLLCINSGQPTILCLFVREPNSAVCPFVSLDNQLS